MAHGEAAEYLADILIGITPDFLEHLMNALGSGQLDLESLSVDDVVDIAVEALALSAGVAAQQYIRNHHGEVRTAVAEALAGAR
jgi:hypothetical protein